MILLLPHHHRYYLPTAAAADDVVVVLSLKEVSPTTAWQHPRLVVLRAEAVAAVVEQIWTTFCRKDGDTFYCLDIRMYSFDQGAGGRLCLEPIVSQVQCPP